MTLVAGDPLLSAFLDDLAEKRDLGSLAVLCDYLQEQEHPSAPAVRQSWQKLVEGFALGRCRFCDTLTQEGKSCRLCGAEGYLSCWEDELAGVLERLGRKLPFVPPPLPPRLVADWLGRWPRWQGSAQLSLFVPCSPMLTNLLPVDDIDREAFVSYRHRVATFERRGLCPRCKGEAFLEARRYFFVQGSAEGILVWSALHKQPIPHVLWWKEPRKVLPTL